MMSVLRKKRKGGFTLIELIVVIAILGILAAIAIPRFSGFTNRSKIQADLQQQALISSTAKVLVASGDIAVGTGDAASRTITLTGSTLSFGAGITKPTTSKNPAADVLTMFTNTIEIKALQYYTTVTVSIDGNGATVLATTGP